MNQGPSPPSRVRHAPGTQEECREKHLAGTSHGRCATGFYRFEYAASASDGRRVSPKQGGCRCEDLMLESGPATSACYWRATMPVAEEFLLLESGVASRLPATAFAQGAFAGVVRDSLVRSCQASQSKPSPALIEGTRSVVTDGTGQYRIIDLRPGTYTLTFSLQGFSTVRREKARADGLARRHRRRADGRRWR